jgi:hypothetical protein
MPKNKIIKGISIIPPASEQTGNSGNLGKEPSPLHFAELPYLGVEIPYM